MKFGVIFILNNDAENMFIYRVSQLRSMRVTRQIVLTRLTKALYKFGCFKEKFGRFSNFGSGNAAILLSCLETILHACEMHSDAPSRFRKV